MIPMGKTTEELVADPVDQQSFQPDDSGSLCARLNDKWTVVALWKIASAEQQRIRFSALRRQIKGVTQRMLTLTLRNLERDGLVLRSVYPEVPPRVEYELTQLGAGMLEALKVLNHWINQNMPAIESARRAYDLSEEPGHVTRRSQLQGQPWGHGDAPGLQERPRI